MSTSVGRTAENAAAEYLKCQGYEILAQNWRSRWCEIDIIAKKKNAVYFVEVKYRGSSNWGGGLDYITAKKLQQMRFAAEFWISSHPKNNFDYQLSAIELSGDPPEVTNWIEDVA